MDHRYNSLLFQFRIQILTHESNFHVTGFSYGSNTHDAMGRISHSQADFDVATTTTSWILADKIWIPDLPKGLDNYRFGWIRDTPIRLQIQRNEPSNLSTMNPLVINLAAARLTSPRRLTLACELKNTSKCTEKQPNHRKQLIQLMSGVPQLKNGVLFLTEMN
jgi:hypothetical protein